MGNCSISPVLAGDAHELREARWRRRDQELFSANSSTGEGYPGAKVRFPSTSPSRGANGLK